jgi:hypothetical protein
MCVANVFPALFGHLIQRRKFCGVCIAGKRTTWTVTDRRQTPTNRPYSPRRPDSWTPTLVM